MAIARSLGPTRLPHSSGMDTAMPSRGTMKMARFTLRSRRVMASPYDTTHCRFLAFLTGFCDNFYAMKTNYRLDPAVTEVLRPELPALADEIVEAIRQEVPEYARPLRGGFARGIRAGVEEALERFGAPDSGRGGGVYQALGRGEYREGRS